MSVQIHLISTPEYYTNLDIIKGQLAVFLSKTENISAVLIKLEGESSTSLTVPKDLSDEDWSYNNVPLKTLETKGPNPNGTRPWTGTDMQETHKILYQLAQVYPPKSSRAADGSASQPSLLQPGHHTFPFQFKVPFNNMCSEPMLLAQSGVLVDPEGNVENNDGGPGKLARNYSGLRVMDGTKQLTYTHVKQALPPSFTGDPGQAEIRYFLKVTVLRPGLFKDNWKTEVGFKFLPIEPPRPPPTTREVFARRPFIFRPRPATPTQPPLTPLRKMSGFFRANNSTLSLPMSPHPDKGDDDSSVNGSLSPHSPSHSSAGLETGLVPQDGVTPSIQITALLPFPAILTCNKAIPLRLVAKKLTASHEMVYLTSLQISLVGKTRLRCKELRHSKTSTWVITSRWDLAIPVCDANSPLHSEMVLPNDLWSGKSLPNTVTPSFMTCNISREYHLELRIGLSWGLPPLGYSPQTPMDGDKLSKKESKERKAAQKAASKAMKAVPLHLQPQSIVLPLAIEPVQVYSGMRPNQPLIDAVHKYRKQQEQQHGRRPGPRPGQRQAPRQRQEPPQPQARPPLPARHHQQPQPVPATLPEDRAEMSTQTEIVEMPVPMNPVELPADRKEASLPLTPRRPSGGTLSPGGPVIRRRPVPPPRPTPEKQAHLMEGEGQEHAPYSQQRSPHQQYQEQRQMKVNLHLTTPQHQQQHQQQQQQQHHHHYQHRQPEKEPQTRAQTKEEEHAGMQQEHALQQARPLQQYHMHRQQTDPLYPPQLQAGEDPAFANTDTNRASVAYEAPPPTYDEAMADYVSGPAAMDRPAFSGETAENAPVPTRAKT